ncbi:hypothetical protein DPMN_107761 [Dreissena polymorpha]|uniref:Uncharacterized protein n=1 Tax=Dreissena polymorpha TaxID=45954 RepID=A0A9D4QK94_DREPO|nr:hypothetical protein DPMN_107761 [Dreissena polymorpha]
MREALSSCRPQGKQRLFDFRYFKSTRLDFRLAENLMAVQFSAYVPHGGVGGSSSILTAVQFAAYSPTPLKQPVKGNGQKYNIY